MEDGKINELQAVKHKLSPKDKLFAEDLISAHMKYGKLTLKQQPWVSILIDRATKPKPEQVPEANIGALSGIIALFNKAAQKLKAPAIVLGLGAGEIRISRAADTSANPGHIYLRVLPEDTYAGKVTPTGDFLPWKGAFLSEAKKVQVVELLKELAKDPAGVAAAHGKLTGKCCFCNSKLTDPKSTDVGYGPVCAKHYDLPWGNQQVIQVFEVPGVTPQSVAAAIAKQQLNSLGLTLHPVPEEADVAEQEAAAEDAVAVWSPTEEQIAEQEELVQQRPSRKIEFDKTPGLAVQNLLEALNG